jgi:hypothetical protein
MEDGWERVLRRGQMPRYRYRDEIEEHWARTEQVQRARRKRRAVIALALIAIVVGIAFAPPVRSQWQPYLDRLELGRPTAISGYPWLVVK